MIHSGNSGLYLGPLIVTIKPLTETVRASVGVICCHAIPAERTIENRSIGSLSFRVLPSLRTSVMPGLSFQSLAVGVGSNEPEALS